MNRKKKREKNRNRGVNKEHWLKGKKNWKIGTFNDIWSCGCPHLLIYWHTTFIDNIRTVFFLLFWIYATEFKRKTCINN